MNRTNATMRTTLLTALALLLATPAWAGGMAECRGTVVIDTESDPGTPTIALESKKEYGDCLVTPLPTTDSSAAVNKAREEEAKRFLKMCPLGSTCSIKNWPELNQVRRVK